MIDERRGSIGNTIDPPAQEGDDRPSQARRGERDERNHPWRTPPAHDHGQHHNRGCNERRDSPQQASRFAGATRAGYSTKGRQDALFSSIQAIPLRSIVSVVFCLTAEATGRIR